MKILFFAAKYPPSVGGIERYTSSLAKKLIEKGHAVAVATSFLEDREPAYERDADGVDIHRIPVSWFIDKRFPIPHFGKETKRIKKMLSEKFFDMVVIQARFYLTHMWAAKICKKYDVPAIVVEHGTAYLIRDGIVGLFGKLYEHIGIRYIYRKCKNFYGVSQACCEWLAHFGVQSKGCLYNAVDPEHIEHLAKKGEQTVVERFSFEGKTTIAFAGRFIKEKGAIALINAYKEIHIEFPNTQLVMAGDGPQWEEARRMNVSGVYLPGALPYEQTLALLKNSQIFCLPTFSEGFSTAVLEAAVLKTAIITTKTGGSPQLIIDENHGCLLDSMNSEDIVVALRKMLMQPEYAKTCAENAYQQLIQNFTWDKTADSLINAERI